jgi:hypothetical protein
MKKSVLFLAAALAATAAIAYDIHHPNLRDAFMDAENAIKHVQISQATNKGIEFGGHAEKAIEHFRAAQQELIEGDKYNDSHQHR